MSKQLATWQRLAIDRAVVVELESAWEAFDLEKICVAEAYLRDALNLHTAAARRVLDLSQVAA